MERSAAPGKSPDRYNRIPLHYHVVGENAMQFQLGRRRLQQPVMSKTIQSLNIDQLVCIDVSKIKDTIVIDSQLIRDIPVT